MEGIRMKLNIFYPLSILFSISLLFSQTETQETVFDQISWQRGPCTSKMENIAEIRVPGGHMFARSYDTRLLMEALGNIPTGEEVGLLAPETFEWFVVFEFSETGYVRDDEKNELDADAMFASIKKSNEEANKVRKKKGFTSLEIVGWETKPHYNELTHDLEWAIKGVDEDGYYFVNHNIRLLGRKGIMKVTLVVDPRQLNMVLPNFRNRISEFSFQSGQKYAEYRQGDKVAEYGLTALVVGGAAAVAAKSGLLKYLWKIIVGVAVAVGAFLKRLFGRRSKSSLQN